MLRGYFLLLVQFLRNLLRKRIPDTQTCHKSQKGIEITGYLLLSALTISYFTGTVKDLILILGLL